MSLGSEISPGDKKYSPRFFPFYLLILFNGLPRKIKKRDNSYRKLNTLNEFTKSHNIRDWMTANRSKLWLLILIEIESSQIVFHYIHNIEFKQNITVSHGKCLTDTINLWLFYNKFFIRWIYTAIWVGCIHDSIFSTCHFWFGSINKDKLNIVFGISQEPLPTIFNKR